MPMSRDCIRWNRWEERMFIEHQASPLLNLNTYEGERCSNIIPTMARYPMALLCDLYVLAGPFFTLIWRGFEGFACVHRAYISVICHSGQFVLQPLDGESWAPVHLARYIPLDQREILLTPSRQGLKRVRW